MPDSDAADVAETLVGRDETLATAESATGGLLSSTLVDVPGASDWFDRGYVTYSYAAKRQEVDVDADALEEHGAVSDVVAEQMAAGAVEEAGVDWAVATTGVAGPTGGTPENPVGTVYVGVAGREGDGVGYVDAERFEFEGSRTELKQEFAAAALDVLLSALSDAG